MTDQIALTGIEVRARHGVLPSEQEQDQPFVVDVILYADLSVAAGSDDLDDTVDYGNLAQSIHDVVADESHALLEKVADRVASVALDEARVEKVVVTVHKPEAPIAVPFRDVSVTIERRR